MVCRGGFRGVEIVRRVWNISVDDDGVQSRGVGW